MIQVLGGLDHANAEPGPDGAGDHARANGTFLTGVRVKKSATDIHAGVSIDQVMATRVGHLTRFPSLELSCEPGHRSGACDSGYSCAYQFNLAWSDATTPVTPEANPRLAFERLFGAGAAGERAANLERRRSSSGRSSTSCSKTPDDCNRGSAVATPRSSTSISRASARSRRASSRPSSSARPRSGRADARRHSRGLRGAHELMYDMLALAFQTDSTRVATLLLAHDGSNRSFDHIGISEGHHDLSHHQQPRGLDRQGRRDRPVVHAAVREVPRPAEPDRRRRRQLAAAQLDDRLRRRQRRRQPPHALEPAAHPGRRRRRRAAPGRFVQHGGKPASNLFLSMADRMGVEGMRRFGDSTARLADV